MKRILTGLLLTIASIHSIAQTQPATVQVIGKPHAGAIWLRWAPSRPLAWKYANQYGYVIERYTINRDGKTLEHPEKLVLHTALKPAPLPAWEKAADTSDYAAIVAQALYGASFKTDIKKEGALMDIVNRATEQEQRFAYALFASDRSFAVAQQAGLGFIDKNVKPTEKYLYRIYTNIPAAKMPVDTGMLFTGLKDEIPLPKPLDLGAMFADKAAMLSWNYILLKEVYNGYIIERSNGIDQPFTAINKEPIVNANEKDTLVPSRIFYIDSLKENYTMYYYRVRGLDPFGELGPPSDTVQGRGLPSLPYNPKITRSALIGTQQVDFEWEFPAAGDDLITGFSIISAGDAKGPFDTLQRNIPVNSRQFLLDQPLLPSNYMAVVAVGKNGTIASSFPVLVQPEDTIPPAMPLGLEGVVDSTGHITLHWRRNTERDMMGYRVFRSNRPGDGFVQLTVSPQADTLFRDSVQMNTLHHMIYYKIVASDKRYNQSAFTPVLALTKPDKTLPSSPVFTSYELKDGQVKLTWINSPDKEVVKYRLLRRPKAQVIPMWELVKEFSNTGAATDSLTDAPALETPFSYTLQAVALNGIVSSYAPALTISIPADAGTLPVPQLKAVVDRDSKEIILTWKFEAKGARQYILYKGSDTSPMTLLQTLDASRKTYTDTQLEINKQYQYTIKVVMENGRQSRYAPVNHVVY
jgi:hypothetical protein